MKKILIQTTDTRFCGGRMFEPPYTRASAKHQLLWDQSMFFLNHLRERLREKGYLLLTADDHDLNDCEWVFFSDAFEIGPESYPHRWIWRKSKHRIRKVIRPRQRRELYQECIAAGLGERVVFRPVEPPAVHPHNWDPALHALFPMIFTYATTLIDGKKYRRLLLPQLSSYPPVLPVSFVQKKLLVCIQGNKFSNYPLELYSARRATIRYFERNYPEKFELYGFGWNQPIGLWQKVFPPAREFYPSYRGTVQNKWDVFPRYRFGLIYENCVFPGWVSEKLFDCMAVDCVPVYWGAPDITDFVSSDSFVDRRNFQSDEELADYLMSMTEAEYNTFRDAMRVYLSSEQFKQHFSFEACADTVMSALKL